MNTKTLEKEIKKINGLDTLTIQEVGDDHLYTGLKTPMKPTAFLISDQKKKRKNRQTIWKNNGRYGIRFNR